MTFDEIKTDSEQFAKFTEVLNSGIDLIYKSREMTDNMWIVRAALSTMVNMCDSMMMEKGVTRKEINEFDHEIIGFIDDLYQEFVTNRNMKNETSV